MIEHHICKSGIGYPEDLAILKKAYDRVLVERGLSEGCPQAAALAATAMDLFRLGVVDDEFLHCELQRNAT